MLESQKKRFYDPENFMDSIKKIFDIMKKSVKKSIFKEGDQGSLHFSGKNSGIIIKDFEDFPLNNYSVIIEFVFENLISANKSEITKNFFKEKFNNNNEKNENSAKKKIKQLNDFFDFNSNFEQNKNVNNENNYSPRLYSLLNKNENYLFEALIDVFNNEYFIILQV